MTTAQILFALRLVTFHGPDAQIVQINPEKVVALRDPRGRPGEHFAPGIHCLIFTSDAKYTSVVETCTEVSKSLEDGK